MNWLNILSNRFLHYGVLIALLFMAYQGCNEWKNEAEIQEKNTNELLRETSIKTKRLELDNKKLRELFPSFLDSIEKEYNIKSKNIQKIHFVKWRTKWDTLLVPIQIIKNDTIPCFGERWELDTFCIKQKYFRPAGDSVGKLEIKRDFDVNIIAYRTRPKPKFWSWLGGKWEQNIIVTSPCFPDSSIFENILFEKK
jgi:predicted nuclease of restriction endonuclease-like RecB superfamily